MSTSLIDSKPRLLADIGGTNARFAILVDGEVKHVTVLACREHVDLVTAIRAYLEKIQLREPLFEASIAVAAPLQGDQVRMTNHAWKFSVAETRKQLALQRLFVLNDFTALAMSLRHLPSEELLKIGGNDAVAGAPIALIGPGTGLGVSGLIPHSQAWLPLQGEGGHVTLAASNDREADALRVMRKRFSHVSAERILSGPGLVNLYEALCALEHIDASVLSPAEVTQRALSQDDPRCIEALNMFCALLGTVAGNLVLTLGAVGGVFIGGGIVPSLGKFFSNSEFRARFEDKGRYREYLNPVPAWVINSAMPAFVGLTRSFVDPGPRIEG